MKNGLIGGLILLFLLGFATISKAQQEGVESDIQAAKNKATPVCKGTDDCAAKWDAAQLWIVHNGSFKIQTVSSVLIETYSPTSSDIGIGMRATKEPIGAGKYQILLSVWQSYTGGLTDKDKFDITQDFNKNVNAASP